jgi:hypothetical protein
MSSFDRTLFYTRVRDFVHDLNSEFSRQQDSLKLFNRLIERLAVRPDPEQETTIVDKFEAFIQANRTGIVAKDVSKLSVHVIVFHGKINIKLGELFRLADERATATIWAHLQCLLNVIDPDNEELEQALESYRQTKQTSPNPESTDDVDENSNEAKFIKSIIGEIQPTIEMNTRPGGDNPLGGIDMMSLFSKVTSMLDNPGMNSLDPEKLLSTVHKVSMRELQKVKRSATASNQS